MDPANLYRALRRMKRDGLVQEVTGPETGEGPDRRYFRLTPAGHRVAASEAARASRLARLARSRKLLPGVITWDVVSVCCRPQVMVPAVLL